jgi:carbamoyl-phosphate synthase small subunit
MILLVKYGFIKGGMEGYLVLENGQVFSGKRIGANRNVAFEIVFNTSMSGYMETLTDPSYAGQGVVFTYPLIGNYGVMYDDVESSKA